MLLSRLSFNAAFLVVAARAHGPPAPHAVPPDISPSFPSGPGAGRRGQDETETPGLDTACDLEGEVEGGGGLAEHGLDGELEGVAVRQGGAEGAVQALLGAGGAGTGPLEGKAEVFQRRDEGSSRGINLRLHGHDRQLR